MIDKDPDQNWLNLPAWLTYLFVVFISSWGGLVNIIQRYRLSKERRFNLIEIVGELTISAFAGMIVYYFCTWIKLDGNLMAGIVGLAGHMGSRVIYMLEQVLKEKFSSFSGVKDLRDPDAGAGTGVGTTTSSSEGEKK